jgi:hypothetical protein
MVPKMLICVLVQLDQGPSSSPCELTVVKKNDKRKERKGRKADLGVSLSLIPAFSGLSIIYVVGNLSAFSQRNTVIIRGKALLLHL